MRLTAWIATVVYATLLAYFAREAYFRRGADWLTVKLSRAVFVLGLIYLLPPLGLTVASHYFAAGWILPVAIALLALPLLACAGLLLYFKAQEVSSSSIRDPLYEFPAFLDGLVKAVQDADADALRRAGSGVDVNAPSVGGATLLTLALDRPWLYDVEKLDAWRSVIAALLDRGADPNRPSGRIEPFVVLAGLADPSVLNLLLDRGANPDACDEYGRPATHILVGSGRADLAKQLVERGADPQGKDSDGRTLGMRIAETPSPVAQDRDWGVVLWLLDRGIDPKVAANDGRTLIELVKSAPVRLAEPGVTLPPSYGEVCRRLNLPAPS